MPMDFETWLRDQESIQPRPGWLNNLEFCRQLYQQSCAVEKRESGKAEASAVARLQAEIASLQKAVADLRRGQSSVARTLNWFLDLILGDPKEEKDQDEPKLIRLIKGVAWDLIREKQVLRDAGDWDSAREFGPGVVVSHNGVSWMAEIQNKGLAPGTDNAVWRSVAKSDARQIELLQERVRQLEAKPQLRYRDVWAADVQYEAGDCVTQSGSMWVSKGRNSNTRPGSSDIWKLAVKAGRDSRDRKVPAGKG